MIDALDLRNVDALRKEGVNALTERLGPIGMVNFIRLFDNGNGDYSTERREIIKDISEIEFLEFLKSNK